MQKTALAVVCLNTLCAIAIHAADVTTLGGSATAVPVFTGSSVIGNSIMSSNSAGVFIGGYVDAVGPYYLSSLPILTQSGDTQSVGVGAFALNGNTGYYNTALGYYSNTNNSTAYLNTAAGYSAMNNGSSGSYNTALGALALTYNSTGAWNTALGYYAGGEITGNNNIDIGSEVYGAAGESGVTRIGNPSTQSAAYIGGIYGVTTGLTGAVDVVVASNGQLGTVSSSLRYKEDVRDMDSASDGLFRLRPVTFRYKQPYTDGSKPVDYGLIAEEVAQVYPDLVARNAQGQVESVQYFKLTPMLLNEVQKQHQQLEQQASAMERQAETIRLLEQRLAALEGKTEK